MIPISSSSKGNAYIVESDHSAILIDCGVSYKVVCARCESCGFDIGKLKAALITHNHSDHISGLSVLVKRLSLPLIANHLTAQSVSDACKIDISNFLIFENNQDFEYEDLNICPFSIPHDTSDPVGYLISDKTDVYFHATDVGTPLSSIGEMLSKASIATLESNHDLEMLYNSGRERSLIMRISGPRGHLSNEEAAELIVKYASPSLKNIFLAHLSHDCNDPVIAQKTMIRALSQIGRKDVLVSVLN
jgi:phosphoribosyl 1,2-cyclic phosphodiesterase